MIYLFSQDCLPQEEYRLTYPNGESESPYVFICSSPQELPVKFPISGSHKICKKIMENRNPFLNETNQNKRIMTIERFVFTDKLDDAIHIAAVKALQRMAKNKEEGS